MKTRAARLVQPLGLGLGKGTPITMSDGWRGKITDVRGSTFICWQDGTVPNDYLHGCRAVDRRLVTMAGGKASVTMQAKPATAPRRPVAARRSADVVNLERAKLEREWDQVPYQW